MNLYANTSHALIEVTRNEIFVNSDFIILQIVKENNLTLNSMENILKWNFTNDKSLSVCM